MLSKDFEAGGAMEVIDYEMDQIEVASFEAVLNLIHERKKSNHSLLVVTICGRKANIPSLLYYLFDVKFQHGPLFDRKGLNAMLLRTNFNKTKEILIIDVSDSIL